MKLNSLPFLSIIKRTLFSSLSIIILVACSEKKSANEETALHSEVPKKVIEKNITPQKNVEEGQYNYDLSSFSQVFALKSILLEISGLSYDKDNQQLLTINDEQGLFFYINPKDGSITGQKRFGGDADYEGVTKLKDNIFICQSNGKIYQYNLSSENTKVHKTRLSLSNDVEGICTSHDESKLLLACKAKSVLGTKEKKKDKKSVFAFDIKTQKLLDEPFYTIKDSELENWVETHYEDKDISKKKLKNLKKRAKDFSPSGIAIHPLDGKVYILSSVGKQLIVYNQKGYIDYVYFLDKDVHTQPEGICFSPDGTLYISNEGKGLVAKIFVYDMKAK